MEDKSYFRLTSSKRTLSKSSLKQEYMYVCIDKELFTLKIKKKKSFTVY